MHAGNISLGKQASFCSEATVVDAEPPFSCKCDDLNQNFEYHG